MVQMLSRSEFRALRGMPVRARQILVREWTHPESRPTVQQILRAADPTIALAREISSQVRSEVRRQIYFEGLDVPPPTGLGDPGLFDSAKRAVKRVSGAVSRFRSKTPMGRLHNKIRGKVSDARKRVVARVKPIVKRVGRQARKVIKKVGPHMFGVATGGAGYLAFKKYRKRIGGYAKQYAPVVLPIVGAVLAPFTAGASLAAATLITTGMKYYEQRKIAKAAKDAQKAEAGQLAAAAQAQEAELLREIDAFYDENVDIFVQNGIPPEKWGTLTLEAKLGVIDMIASGKPIEGAGTPPPNPPANATPPYPGCVWLPRNPTSAETVEFNRRGYSIEGPDSDGFYWACPPRVPTAPRPGSPSPPVPSIPSTGGGYPARSPETSTWDEDEPDVPGAPAGTYDLIVEGVRVGSAGTLAKIAELASAQTSKGDRYEIFHNGKSLGLKIRGSSGPIPVPAAKADQVRQLTRKQVLDLVENAEAKAGKKGGIGTGLIVAALATGAVVFASH